MLPHARGRRATRPTACPAPDLLIGSNFKWRSYIGCKDGCRPKPTFSGGIAVGTNERATQERETFAAWNPLLIVSPEAPMRAQHTNERGTSVARSDCWMILIVITRSMLVGSGWHHCRFLTMIVSVAWGLFTLFEPALSGDHSRVLKHIVFSSNAPRVIDNVQKWLRALLLSSVTGQPDSWAPPLHQGVGPTRYHVLTGVYEEGVVGGRPCGGRDDEGPRMRRSCNRSACRRARRLRKLSLPPRVAVTASQARQDSQGLDTICVKMLQLSNPKEPP